MSLPPKKRDKVIEVESYKSHHFSQKTVQALSYGCEPKIEGKKTQKWMVKIMENPIKTDDLEGNTHIPLDPKTMKHEGFKP